MGTFFLIFALIIFAVLGYGFSLSFGFLGAMIYSTLVIAGIISAIMKAWNKLSQRLDRIEKALGIEETPEEIQDGERKDASDHIEKALGIEELPEEMQDVEWEDASDDPPSPSD